MNNLNRSVSFPLTDYIQTFYHGNQSAFAVAQGVKRQQITKWLKAGFIVVDGMLYSPRREISPPKNNQP